MAQKFNFSDYNASGVYFIEIDNSVITSSNVQTALRLAVGFNMQGPFNRPVYISTSEECTSLFGKIDQKLERQGCFTNRNIRTMIGKAPVYALNLLSVNTLEKDTNKDTVGFVVAPLSQGMDSSVKTGYYANMYDRTRFWIADDETFVDKNFLSASKSYKDASTITDINEGVFFGLGNCGTKDMSVIVKKSDSASGFDVTFLDYYGTTEDIPYKWINPTDYVSDYFVDVIALSGDWGESRFEKLADDKVYSKFFTKSGLDKNKVNQFLKTDAVVKIGSWTGCILPNFIDKQGNIKSIDYIINKSCNETGLLFGLNQKAMDHVSLDSSKGESYFFFDTDGDGVYDPAKDVAATFVPDFVGHKFTYKQDSSTFKYMSHRIDMKDSNGKKVDASKDASNLCVFETRDASVYEEYTKGDFVKDVNGLLTRIVERRMYEVAETADASAYTVSRYVTNAAIQFDTNNKVELHKPIKSMYEYLVPFKISGLKICNRHMPGFDENGVANVEKGVKKIYKMLEDEGIRKGLLNDDAIDFRYIVDTLSYGLGNSCAGKIYLSKLAKEKQHCTAIINAPSMSQFANSDNPFFGETYDKNSDSRSTFNVKYIPQGGNPDMIYSADTEMFTLMDFEDGADHAALFSSFLKYSDGNKMFLIPPAADVSNTMMNKFLGGDPYKTVANLNGIISNSAIVGVEYPFDEEDRGYLEPFGINPIIERGGRIMIYGDRTAYQTVNSDLSFLHVRELLNTIQISCTNVLNDYVFSYNIPTTRAEIVTRINPILSAMQDSGALVKYEIQCDDLNNTKDVIDNKFAVVNIGVWVAQCMEKIIVPITINRSTTA